MNYYSTIFSAVVLLFAPLAIGAVQNWAIGIILFLILSAAVSYLIQQQKVPFKKTPLDKPFMALLGLTFCSLIFSVHYYVSIIAVAQLLAYLFFYYILLQIGQERPRLIFLLYWIISVSALLCVIGLGRRSGMNLTGWLDNLGLPQSSSHWLTATFGNHNHMAGWLEMSIPLLLCLILFGCQREWLPLQISLLLLQGTCLVLTFSRGGWAGTTAAIAFIVIYMLTKRRNRYIILFSGATIAVIGIFLLASPSVVQRLNTIGLEDRMLIWRGTINMILMHWLAGTGPGTYAIAFAQFQPPGFSHRYYNAHNDYLQFTAEMGLILPILIIWMGVVLYRHGLCKMKSSSKLEQATTLGSLAGITGILVHSVSDFNLHIPANALLFTTLVAFAMREKN